MRIDQENAKPALLPLVPFAVLQLAYDLRRDLAGIDRQLEALRTRIGPDATLDNDFAAVSSAIDSGFDAARELIAFARRSAETGQVDVNGLVHQVRGVIERMLGPGIRVYVDLSPSRPVVRADAAMLEWVLLGLVLLGRKATAGRGAVTIGTLAVDERSSDVPGQPAAGSWALLTVSDTGLGLHQGTCTEAPITMPPELQSDITLHDVRAVVRKLGASLYAQEVKPYGTHVHVYLPSLRSVARSPR